MCDKVGEETQENEKSSEIKSLLGWKYKYTSNGVFHFVKVLLKQFRQFQNFNESQIDLIFISFTILLVAYDKILECLETNLILLDTTKTTRF